MGVSPSELRDPLRWQELKDTTMSGASRLSVGRLGQLVSSYRRWLQFCTEHDADHRNPSPLLLASFLKKVTLGGPTASASMHAALTWFMSSLGANIPVAHWLVKPFKFHASSHSGRQAPELEPWELANNAQNHCVYGGYGGGRVHSLGALTKVQVCAEPYCLG